MKTNDADGKTEIYYRRIVGNLMTRYQTACLTDLAQALSFSGLSRATLRQYAVAIRFCLRRDDPSSLQDFEMKWRNFSLVRDQQDAEKKKPDATKNPQIKIDLLQALLGKIEDTHTGIHLRDLLLATLRFGLRPCEWSSVKWADPTDRLCVIVNNAKYTRSQLTSGPYKGRTWNRGNGEKRFIHLNGSAEEIEESRALIEAMMRHEKSAPWSDGAVARSLQRCFQKTREILLKEGSLLWRQRNLTIYNFRHQFAADAKASFDLEAGEVAALMGHVSPKTAVVSYGRKNHGRAGSLRVSPAASSIAEVQIEGRPPVPPPAKDPAPIVALNAVQDAPPASAPPSHEASPHRDREQPSVPISPSMEP